MWDVTFIYFKQLQDYLESLKNNLLKQYYNYYYSSSAKMTFVVIDDEEEAQEIDISVDDNVEIFYSTIEKKPVNEAEALFYSTIDLPQAQAQADDDDLPQPQPQADDELPQPQAQNNTIMYYSVLDTEN